MTTAEEALKNYAARYVIVARFNKDLGDPEFGECVKRDDEGDCLDRLFHCPRGPNDERPRWEEFNSAMCPRCKTRLAMLDERKLARAKLGAAKRTLLKVGKRLLSEPPASGKGEE